MSKVKFERVYHPYYMWEEVLHNMWGISADRQADLKKAIAFTSDHHKYGEFMMLVASEWTISCENALTDYRINRKAWIGHAAVAMALYIPEDVTREAWRHLTDEQRILANREAERAIQHWEDCYAENKRLRESLGRTVLSGRNT